MKRILLVFFLIGGSLVGCVSSPKTPDVLPIENADQKDQIPVEESIYDLSEDEIETLLSLDLVDNYPLYTMSFSGEYGQPASTSGEVDQPAMIDETWDPWACTLFTSLADEDNRLYGRNFDWEYSPALLLFTDPPDGYASVSIVDIAYLGYSGDEVSSLNELPLSERIALLDTPWWPFDGMNEHGLVVGMAAVPSGDMIIDPQKPTLGSLEVIRKILDEARDVDEAIEIFNQNNIDMRGGPDLHYLIADRTGKAVLVEFYNGEMYLIPNDHPWHLATNFLCSAVNGPIRGKCWRYDQVLREFEETEGNLNLKQAMTLLGMVSQAGTQWSVVYGMSTGSVNVVMGQEYFDIHTFQLDLIDQ
jgi:hypothetical protein